MHIPLPADFHKSLKAAFALNAYTSLEAIKAHYAGCMRCPLATSGRTQVVFGSGNPHGPILFIGEAPGKDEDEQGAPFVGRSGKLLRTIIADAGITTADFFISNTTKCRPPENRPPTVNEKTTCTTAILVKEIALIRPQLICTLGATATSTFLDTQKSISSLRGQIVQTEYFAIMPTYHPSYLLRNRSAIDTVKNDFMQIRSFLAANK